MAYFVEQHRRPEGSDIVHTSFLETYCETEGQQSELVDMLLTGFDRIEYYFRDREGRIVANMMLIIELDMHHGKVAMMLAHFVLPECRGDYSLHCLMMKYVRIFCRTFGIRKYQRSIHVSETEQRVITKTI